jgi:hypothetical protein
MGVIVEDLIVVDIEEKGHSVKDESVIPFVVLGIDVVHIVFPFG